MWTPQLPNFIRENDALADFDILKGSLSMLVRVITSLIGVAVMTPIMWFSDTYVFPLALAFFSLMALIAVFSCIKLRGKLFITLPTYIIGVAMPFLCKYVGELYKISAILFGAIFIYLLYLMFCAVIFHKRCDLSTLSVCFILVIYVIGGFSCMQVLRGLPDGILAVISVILAAWVTDIFAYFTGKLIGKHKLCETISPKKTIEGSIGGIVFCAIVFVIYALIIFNGSTPTYAYVFMVLVSIVLSVVAQIGDLTLSLFKRRFGIKDFGTLFPGHGGVLDRFDSIIAVAPVFLIIILFANYII